MDSFPGITVLRSRLDARGSSPCRSRYSAVSTRSLRLKANRLRLDCHMDILSIGIAYRPPMACACARKGVCNAYRNRKLYGYAMPIISIANPKGGAGKTTLAFIIPDQLTSTVTSLTVFYADTNRIISQMHNSPT